MIEQTCSTCRWWQRSIHGQPDDHAGPDKTPESDFLRECHRFPPRIAPEGKCEVEHERPDGSTYTLEHGWYGAWPLTFEDDCCGEYAPAAPRAPVRRGPLGSPGGPAGPPPATPAPPTQPHPREEKRGEESREPQEAAGTPQEGATSPQEPAASARGAAPDTSPLRSPPPTNACIHEFVHAVLLERGPISVTDVRSIVDATRGTESGKTTIASTISQKSDLYGWITDTKDYSSPALWRVGTPAELAAAEDAGRVARAAGEDMDASPYRVADARTASWQKGWTEAALRSAAPPPEAHPGPVAVTGPPGGTVPRGTLPPEVGAGPQHDASQASPGLPEPVRLDHQVVRRKPKPAEAPPDPPEAPPGAPEPVSAPQDGRRRTLVEAVLAFLQAEGGWWSTQGVRDRLPPRLPVPEDRDVWMALGTLVDVGRAEKKPDPTRPRAFVYHAV